MVKNPPLLHQFPMVVWQTRHFFLPIMHRDVPVSQKVLPAVSPLLTCSSERMNVRMFGWMWCKKGTASSFRTVFYYCMCFKKWHGNLTQFVNKLSLLRIILQRKIKISKCVLSVLCTFDFLDPRGSVYIWPIFYLLHFFNNVFIQDLYI